MLVKQVFSHTHPRPEASLQPWYMAFLNMHIALKNQQHLPWILNRPHFKSFTQRWDDLNACGE